MAETWRFFLWRVNSLASMCNCFISGRGRTDQWWQHNASSLGWSMVRLNNRTNMGWQISGSGRTAPWWRHDTSSLGWSMVWLVRVIENQRAQVDWSTAKTWCFFTWLVDGLARQPDKRAAENQWERADCSLTAKTQCFFSWLVKGSASTCNGKLVRAWTLLNGKDTTLLLLGGRRFG